MANARARRAAVAVTIAIACADVAGGALLLHPDRTDPGTPAAAAPMHPAGPPAPSSTPAPVTPATHAPTTSTPTVTRSARRDTVWIPSQHVRAPVDVCRIVDAELEPPQDVHRTCYWAGGAALGADTGTTVVTGHINWVGQGTGALGNIGELDPGDTVRTSDASGVVTAWTVRSVVHRPKSRGIDPSVFVGTSGPRQLYLVTCGGAFDAADANYLDNIYVRAVPSRP